jgi:predicted unusual protein kinase regulating ubiquinone biosynthesis (AarF/ABC1/UbiB family)
MALNVLTTHSELQAQQQLQIFNKPKRKEKVNTFKNDSDIPLRIRYLAAANAERMLRAKLDIYPQEHVVSQYAIQTLGQLNANYLNITVFKGGFAAFITPSGGIYISDSLLPFAEYLDVEAFAVRHEREHFDQDHFYALTMAEGDLLSYLGQQRISEIEADINSFVDLDEHGLNPQGGIILLNKLAALTANERTSSAAHGSSQGRVVNLETIARSRSFKNINKPLTPIPAEVLQAVSEVNKQKLFDSPFKKLLAAVEQRWESRVFSAIRELNIEQALAVIEVLFNRYDYYKYLLAENEITPDSLIANMLPFYEQSVLPALGKQLYMLLEQKFVEFNLNTAQLTYLWHMYIAYVADIAVPPLYKFEDQLPLLGGGLVVDNELPHPEVKWNLGKAKLSQFHINNIVLAIDDLVPIAQMLSVDWFKHAGLQVMGQPANLIAALLQGGFNNDAYYNPATDEFSREAITNFLALLLEQYKNLHNELGGREIDWDATSESLTTVLTNNLGEADLAAIQQQLQQIIIDVRKAPVKLDINLDAYSAAATSLYDILWSVRNEFLRIAEIERQITEELDNDPELSEPVETIVRTAEEADKKDRIRNARQQRRRELSEFYGISYFDEDNWVQAFNARSNDIVELVRQQSFNSLNDVMLFAAQMYCTAVADLNTYRDVYFANEEYINNAILGVLQNEVLPRFTSGWQEIDIFKLELKLAFLLSTSWAADTLTKYAVRIAELTLQNQITATELTDLYQLTTNTIQIISTEIGVVLPEPAEDLHTFVEVNAWGEALRVVKYQLIVQAAQTGDISHLAATIEQVTTQVPLNEYGDQAYYNPNPKSREGEDEDDSDEYDDEDDDMRMRRKLDTDNPIVQAMLAAPVNDIPLKPNHIDPDTAKQAMLITVFKLMQQPDWQSLDALKVIYYASTYIEDISYAVRLHDAALPLLAQQLSSHQRVNFFIDQVKAQRVVSLNAATDFIDKAANTDAELEEANNAMMEALRTQLNDQQLIGALVVVEKAAEWLVSPESKLEFVIAAIGNGKDDSGVKRFMYRRWAQAHGTDPLKLDSMQGRYDIMTAVDKMYSLDAQTKFALIRELLIGQGGVLINKESRAQLFDYFARAFIRPRTDLERRMMPLVAETFKALAEIDEYDVLYFLLAPILQERMLMRTHGQTPWEDIVATMPPSFAFVFTDEENTDEKGNERDLEAIMEKIERRFDEDVVGCYIKPPTLRRVPPRIVEETMQKLNTYMRDLQSERHYRSQYEALINQIVPPAAEVADSTLSVMDIVRLIAGKSGPLVSRISQMGVIGVYAALDPEFEKELGMLFNDIPRQPKVVAHQTMKLSVPNIAEYIPVLLEPLAGGSMAGVFRTRDVEGAKRIAKIVRPNPMYQSGKLKNVIKTVLTKLVTNFPYLAVLLDIVDDADEWITAEYQSFASFLEMDTQFKAANHGFSIPGNPYSIYLPQTFEPRSPDFIIEEEVDGVDLEKWDEIVAQGYDMQAIVKLIVQNYIHQIASGLSHPNINPGNIRIFQDKVIFLDRSGLGLQDFSNPVDQKFIQDLLANFNNPLNALNALFEYYSATSGKPVTPEQMQSILMELMTSSDPTDPVRTLTTALVVLRKNGIKLPLKITLVAMNILYLNGIAQKAGMANILEALQ